MSQRCCMCRPSSRICGADALYGTGALHRRNGRFGLHCLPGRCDRNAPPPCTAGAVAAPSPTGEPDPSTELLARLAAPRTGRCAACCVLQCASCASSAAQPSRKPTAQLRSGMPGRGIRAGSCSLPWWMRVVQARTGNLELSRAGSMDPVKGGWSAPAPLGRGCCQQLGPPWFGWQVLVAQIPGLELCRRPVPGPAQSQGCLSPSKGAAAAAAWEAGSVEGASKRTLQARSVASTGEDASSFSTRQRVGARQALLSFQFALKQQVSSPYGSQEKSENIQVGPDYILMKKKGCPECFPFYSLLQ